MQALMKLNNKTKFISFFNEKVKKVKKVKKTEYANKNTIFNQYRIFDFFFSIGAILLFMPVLIIVSILIKINSPKSSVFFVQKRLGLNGKIFYVYKFRTMVPNAEEKLENMLSRNKELKEEYIKFRKLKNDPRIIPKIGNFLRKTSLDELPQFFNVLLGQMSIVGPRPYIENEFDIYTTRYELETVTAVKPGITGYWQITPSRHDTTFRERVVVDMEYINKKSFRLDLMIIWKTLAIVMRGRGA